jgi:hypothetical protein
MGISGAVVSCWGGTGVVLGLGLSVLVVYSGGTGVVPGVGGGQYWTRQQLSVWLGTMKQLGCTGKVGHLSNKQHTI